MSKDITTQKAIAGFFILIAILSVFAAIIISSLDLATKFICIALISLLLGLMYGS